MGRTVIKVPLSTQGINQAIKELRQFKADLLGKIDLLMKVLADQGAEILRYKIVQMDAVMLGELLSSVDGVYTNNVAVIRMGTDHAAFVEFGTGYQGKINPHPEPKGWKYDVNAHGEAGWWYWGDWDNNWHWTNGFPSRPVLWETAQEIPALVKKLAREVFK